MVRRRLWDAFALFDAQESRARLCGPFDRSFRSTSGQADDEHRLTQFNSHSPVEDSRPETGR